MSSDGDEPKSEADADTESESAVDPDAFDELADADVTTWVDENGLHIAEDEVTGVSSQGPTERKAVSNLAEAVDSYREANEDETGDDWL